MRTSPVTILKRQLADQNREIAHLKEQLAAAEYDTSQFDLKRDTADNIIRVFTDATVISERKAVTIARGILDAFKKRPTHAG